MKRKAGRARNGKGSGAKARAEEQLAAMRLESERVEREQDAERRRVPVTNATCGACGSTRAELDGGRCARRDGCDRRRIARRIAEDKKRGGCQCMASHGSTTIRFCVMRKGHGGKHTDGGREWGLEEESSLGRLFAGALSGRRRVG